MEKRRDEKRKKEKTCRKKTMKVKLSFGSEYSPRKASLAELNLS